MGKKCVHDVRGGGAVAKLCLLTALTMLLSICLCQWQPLTAQAATSPLTHSSDNLGTKYGTWGTTYTCATCHIPHSPNIKRVNPAITTPIGSRPVVFDRLSTSLTGAAQAGIGIFGDDQRTINTNGSQNVCEVCHHQTKYHQYSSSKVATTTHQNRRDCMQCHPHGNAFAPSCNTCHGYPPNSATVGINGQATPATSALQAGQAGAHVAHTNTPFAMQCETCHTGYTATPMGNNQIEIGFGINGTNYPAFGTASSNKGTWYGNSGIAVPYTWKASASGTTISQSANAESCSVYCHGNWTGANGSIATPNWGITDGTQKACGACHGASAAQPPATGSHGRHAGNGAGGLSVACANCHGAVSNNTHVDGKVAWNVAGLSGAPTANYRSAASGSTGAIAPSATFGSCSTLYCHSNVQGATGTGAPTSTGTPTWGGASLACNSCHGSPMATGSHTTHTSTYSFVCDTCHAGAGSGTAKHADGHIDINIAQGKYSTAYPLGYKISGSSAYSSCQNTACHTGAATSPTWGNSGSVAANCQGCHGNEANAATKLSGAHTNHLNKATTGGGFKCKDCHSATITNSDNRTLANRLVHANGYINYTGATAGHQTVATGSHVSCASFYCHSNGKGTFVAPPAWTSGSVLNCNGCHGTSNAQGYPDYANGGSGAQLANSHVKHNPAATDCYKCHRTTASTTAGQLVSGTADHLDTVVNSRLANFNGAFSTYSGSYTTATKTCSTTYCHGNAAAPVWGNAGSTNCGSCHSGNNSLPGAHGIHYAATNLPTATYYNYSGNMSSNTTYRFTCGSCHSGAKGAAHSAGAVSASQAGQVFFGFTSATMKGSYTAGTLAGNDKGFNWSNGGTGCNTTYCHSNGQGSNGLTTVAWSTTSSSGTCVQCHDTKQTGATATGLSGKHDAHMNPTKNGLIGLNNGFNCIDCHAKTVSSNTVLSDKSKHVNKFIDFSSVRGGGSAKYSTSTKQCSNIYCHSNGNPGNLVYVNPAAWNSATTYTCNGCHGTSGFGAPDYANGGAGTATANSHPAHVAKLNITNTTGCANCHVKTADMTTANKFKDYTAASYHLNNTPNVYFKQIGGSTGTTTYAGYNVTCSNTYCHGTAASPAWGSASLACNQCHSANSALPGAHGIHYASATLPSSYTNYSGNMSSSTTYRFTCGSCHSAAKGAVHANGPANANGVAQVFYAITSATMKGSYTYGAAGGTDNGFSWSNGGTGCNTTYCHSNGQGSNGLTTVAWSTTASSGTCVQCHDTKQTTIASGLSAKHDKHMNPSQNAVMGLGNGFNCKDCHSKTITDAGNLLIADKSKHVNKFVDFSSPRGGGSARYNSSTKTCSNIYCHSNGNPGALVYQSPTWTGASLTCTGCHGTSGTYYGAPDYANGGPGVATANSHPTHIAKLGYTDTTGCSNCHAKTADAAVANKFKDYTASSYHLSGGPRVVLKQIGGKNGTYSSNQCSNTYCHGTAASVAWGTVGPLACNSCHSANNTLPGAHQIHVQTAGVASSYTNMSGNVSSAASYRFSCGACHSSVKGAKHANGPANANGPAEVFFGFTSATMKGGVYNYGASSAGTDPTGGFSYTGGGTNAGSCNNTYCHSNGQGSNGLTTVAWSTTASSGTCVQCHDTKQTGATATGLSGKHDAHMNPTKNGLIGLNNGFNCIDCHAKTVSSNTVLSDKSKHVNKFIDFSSVRGGGSAKYSTTTKQCSNIYCHSNGNPGNLVYVNPAAWNSATTYTCNGCHGTSGFGAPDYANGGPVPSATANSHSKHLTALGITDTTGCTYCHIKTANASTANKFKDYTAASYHLNNTPNLFFNTAKAGVSATWTQSTGTCSNVLCHSNGKGTYVNPIWGQTSNCGFCHPIASLSATHAKHIDTTLTPSFYSYTANRSSAATYNFGCSNCHPIVNANHMSGTVLLDFTPGAAGAGTLRTKNSAAITAGGVVAGTANSGTTGTPGSSVTCANVYCHSNGYASNLVFATTPNWYGGSFSGDKCANCHGNSPNVTIAGSATHSAHVVAMHYADVYSGTNGLLKAGTSNAPHGSATEATTYNCNTCHYATVTSSANDSNSVCVTCHYSGNTVGATLKGAASIANKANHVNGRVDISFQTTSIISKAQLRQASFTGATTVANSWNRNGSTNYKNGATAFDTAKSALANTMWAAGGTCSTTACHNGRSVNWYSDAGKAVQCIMCHTNL